MAAVEGKMAVMLLAAVLAQPAWAAGQAKPSAANASPSASPAKAGAKVRPGGRRAPTKAPAPKQDPGAIANAKPVAPPVAAPAPAGTPPEPVGRVADWFPGDAYPPQARAKSQQGQTVYAVELDQAGRIMRCNIVQSSGSELLDSTTCTLVISNGRFRPARDAAGKPVPGRYQGSMRWKLVEGPTSEE